MSDAFVTLRELGGQPRASHYLGAVTPEENAFDNASVIQWWLDAIRDNRPGVPHHLVIPDGVWVCRLPQGANKLFRADHIPGFVVSGTPGSGSTWQGAGEHGAWLLPVQEDDQAPGATVWDLAKSYKVRMSGYSMQAWFLLDPLAGWYCDGNAGDKSDFILFDRVNAYAEFAYTIVASNCGMIRIQDSDLWTANDGIGRQTPAVALGLNACRMVQVSNTHAFNTIGLPGDTAVVVDGCEKFEWDGGHVGGVRAAFRFAGNPSRSVRLANLLASASGSASSTIMLDAPGVYDRFRLEDIDSNGQTVGCFVQTTVDGIGLSRWYVSGIDLGVPTLLGIAGREPAGWYGPIVASTIYTGGKSLAFNPATPMIHWNNHFISTDGMPVPVSPAGLLNYAAPY